MPTLGHLQPFSPLESRAVPRVGPDLLEGVVLPHGLGLGLPGRSRLLQDPLLDLLLLLQGLDEGGLEPVRVLGLQRLLLVGGHAGLAHDGAVLLLPPAAREVRVALRTQVGLPAGHGHRHLP